MIPAIPPAVRAGMVAALVGCPIATAAEERPATVPTRDVDVTYRAGQGDQAVLQRSRWWAEGRRLRLDTPTPGVYAIVDYAAQTLAMVSDAERGVLDLPAPPGGLPGQGGAGRAVPNAAFSRRSVNQVAGLSCTEWETVDTLGQPTIACFTGDGVLLEARRGAQVLVQAVRVAYGILDPAAFVVPPSYRHQTPRSDDHTPGGAR